MPNRAYQSAASTQAWVDGDNDARSWSLAWLSGAAPHSGTTFEIVGSVGVALVAIAACLLVAERLPTATFPLVSVGAMALTAYTGHVLAPAVLDWELSGLLDVSSELGSTALSIAKGPGFDDVRPAVVRFTSGFGGRCGVTHYGVDIANAIGTPIYAMTDGVVEESGPASGFGMWVVVRHPDGERTVYGHVNRSYVTKGQPVRAGEHIADIGNRGFSTGPHLHFEVWAPDGTKLNPLTWLARHGIQL